MNVRVVVVGAGPWGTTVANLAVRNAPTTLWARDPALAEEIDRSATNSRYLPGFALDPALRATSSLQDAVEAADVVVMAVPSHVFRDTLDAVAAHVRPWVPVVSLTKGLEPVTNLRMTEIVEEVLPGHPVGVLTGPNLSKEILDGQAAAAVIALGVPHISEVLQRVFASDLYRVYPNDDVVGCEIAGAVKNVIALASGIADGLGTGDNTRATVITRGFGEMMRLGTALGGRTETLSGLAGMGDLIATCIAQEGRNRSFGEELGRGRPLEELLAAYPHGIEGVRAAAPVMALARRCGVDMPICAEMDAVVNHGRSPAEAYRGLLRRSPQAALRSR